MRGSPQECEAVVEALASVVALNLTSPAESYRERASQLPPLPAEPAPPPSRDSAPNPSGGESTRQLPPHDSSPSIRFNARGALVASFGLLPGMAMGGEVGAGFESEWFSLFAMGRAEAQPADAIGARGERIDGAVFSGGLLPCLSASWFTACGAAWLGVLQGRSPEAVNPSLGSSTVGFVGARVGARVPLGSGLHLTPQLEAWMPLVRTTLVYAETPTWTAPPLVGSFGVGLLYVPVP